MPMRVSQPTSESSGYSLPFVGPINHTAQIEVDITALSDDEIDSKGYLKPGVPFRRAGTLVSGGGQFVFGVTIEPLKVADSNSAEDIAAASAAANVAVATICQINRALAEDQLGRAYTANELAAFDAAGSRCVLLF